MEEAEKKNEWGGGDVCYKFLQKYVFSSLCCLFFFFFLIIAMSVVLTSLF